MVSSTQTVKYSDNGSHHTESVRNQSDINARLVSWKKSLSKVESKWLPLHHDKRFGPRLCTGVCWWHFNHQKQEWRENGQPTTLQTVQCYSSRCLPSLISHLHRIYTDQEILLKRPYPEKLIQLAFMSTATPSECPLPLLHCLYGQKSELSQYDIYYMRTVPYHELWGSLIIFSNSFGQTSPQQALCQENIRRIWTGHIWRTSSRHLTLFHVWSTQCLLSFCFCPFSA